jgi:predicted porin
MKKSLLALAVLGAFASAAQAQVTIGGVVQANLKDYKVGSTARPAKNEIRLDDDYTSRFWLTGTEDLGGGNSALFYIENRFNTDVNNVQGVGNGLGNGDTFFGLKGAWGQLTAGKNSLIYAEGLTAEALAANGTLSAMPSSMWATVSIMDQAAGYLEISRVNNVLMYRLPGNLGGFNGVFAYSTASAGNEGNLACTGSGVTGIVSGNGQNATGTAASTTATTTCPTLTTPTGGVTNGQYSNGREFFIKGGYANGPINVNLMYVNNQVEGRNGTDRSQARLHGYYKFPFGLKIGAIVDKSATQTVAAGNGTASHVTRTAWALPVSYALGNNQFIAEYARAGKLDNGTSINNTGAHMVTLGYDYSLSKRTNVGVYYSKLSNQSAAAYQPFLAGTSATGSGLLAGESATTWALGMKHVF